MFATVAALAVCGTCLAVALVMVHRTITAHENARPRRRLKACQCCGALVGRQWHHDETLCQPRQEKL